MPESSAALDLAAFCAFGTVSETQLFSIAAAEAMTGSDPEKVFSESLCLISTATERAAVSGYAAAGVSTGGLSQSLLSLPFTLHAYVAGGDVLRSEAHSTESVPDNTGELERMMHFYGTHLTGGQSPDQKALRHTMILWMGRISPPRLDEHPEARLDRLHLVERLQTHVRLVQAFARNTAMTASKSPR